MRNWSDVRIFLAVVRNGSTLGASRGLGIAQPTVARRIDALENEIGLTLFKRDTRGFRPTEDARQLFPLAEALEQAALDFTEKSRELGKPRPIRITSPGAFSERAMNIFSEFTALYPDVAFEFIHCLKILDLAKGEADLALRVTAHERDETLISRKLGLERWALFAGRRYLSEFGHSAVVDDLRGHKFVTFERDDMSDFLHRWLMRHILSEQVVSSFGDLDLMLASVRSGRGLGLLPVRFVEKDEAFIRCSANIEELDRPVMLFISPEAYRRQEVKAFAKFFAPRYARLLS